MYARNAIFFAFLLFIKPKSVASQNLTYGKFTKIDNLEVRFDMTQGICAPLQTQYMSNNHGIWLLNANEAALFNKDSSHSITNYMNPGDYGDGPIYWGDAQTYTTSNRWLYRAVDGNYGLQAQYLSERRPNTEPAWKQTKRIYPTKPGTSAVCVYPIQVDIQHPRFPVWIFNGGANADGETSGFTYMWLEGTSIWDSTIDSGVPPEDSVPRMKVARKNHGMH